METKKTQKRSLLWSEQGQVGCTLPGHAPYRGSDTWRWERWRKMSAAEEEAFGRDLGHSPECETCRSIARTQGT
jgi:hypothetical protein